VTSVENVGGLSVRIEGPHDIEFCGFFQCNQSISI
jgi:hypothetical protein